MDSAGLEASTTATQLDYESTQGALDSRQTNTPGPVPARRYRQMLNLEPCGTFVCHELVCFYFLAFFKMRKALSARRSYNNKQLVDYDAGLELVNGQRQ